MSEGRTHFPLDVPRTDGAAVQCPVCLAKFGGMTVCPWDGSDLIPLPDADPTAVAFYEAILGGVQ